MYRTQHHGEVPFTTDEVTLASAARRTGLADSAAGMDRFCQRREVTTTPASTGSSCVRLSAFAAGGAPLELAEVETLESGRL